MIYNLITFRLRVLHNAERFYTVQRKPIGQRRMRRCHQLQFSPVFRRSIEALAIFGNLMNHRNPEERVYRQW